MKVFLLFITCLTLSGLAKSQTFTYIFHSDAGNAYVYDVQTTIKITGVKITQIYNDDGTNNNTSFAYALIMTYSNTITGTNIPTGTNFYTFQLDATSTKKDGTNTTIQSLSNSFQIPIITGSGSLDIGNNPTYKGSASALGYVVGTTYTDAATLARFGYALALTIQGPGLHMQTSNGTSLLPITLKQFSATLSGSNVLINWTTSTETNSNYFTIERSASSTNFVDLQKIAAQGNSNTDINYSITDYSPLNGTSYYRLKETDIDGNITYSSIAAVSNTISAYDKVNFYPTINPTNLVNISGNTANKTLEVFSISGAKVFSTTLTGTQLALPNLSKGMYIFKVTSAANAVQTSKYIQQ